jgi:hypothetical protein
MDFNKYGRLEFHENDYFKLFINNKCAETKDKLNFYSNFVRHQIAYGNTVSFCKDKRGKKELVEIKQEFAEIKATRKDQDAIDLTAAADVDRLVFKDLKKKQLKGESTPGEDLMIQKFFIKDMYKCSMVKTDLDWIKLYNDKSLMNVYNNASTYFKENTGIVESVEALKEHEIRVETMVRSDENHVALNTTDAIVNSLNKKYKYQKHAILVSWLTGLGFNKLIGDTEVDSKTMHENLVAVRKTIINDNENVSLILEKRKHRMVTVLSVLPDDKRFDKNILRFINGAIHSTLGVKIKKKDKHSDSYIIDSLVLSTFKNPYDGNELNPGLLPVLGHDFDHIQVARDKLEDDPEHVRVVVTPEMQLVGLKAWSEEP